MKTAEEWLKKAESTERSDSRTSYALAAMAVTMLPDHTGLLASLKKWHAQYVEERDSLTGFSQRDVGRILEMEKVAESIAGLIEEYEVKA